MTIYNKQDAVTDQIYSVLVLDSINVTDDGEYICRAFNNPLCYIEAKINVTVECEFVASHCCKFKAVHACNLTIACIAMCATHYSQL